MYRLAISALITILLALPTASLAEQRFTSSHFGYTIAIPDRPWEIEEFHDDGYVIVRNCPKSDCHRNVCCWGHIGAFTLPRRDT